MQAPDPRSASDFSSCSWLKGENQSVHSRRPPAVESFTKASPKSFPPCWAVRWPLPVMKKRLPTSSAAGPQPADQSPDIEEFGEVLNLAIWLRVCGSYAMTQPWYGPLSPCEAK